MTLRYLAGAACGIACLSLLGCNTAPATTSVESGPKPGQGMSQAQIDAMKASRTPPNGANRGVAPPANTGDPK